MSNASQPVAEIAPGEVTLAPPRSDEAAFSPASGSKRLRWFELSLVLMIAFGDSLATGLYLYAKGRPTGYPGTYGPLIGLIHEVVALLLLGYVLYRRGLRFRDIGLRWSITDLWTGPLVTVVSFLAYFAGRILIHMTWHAIFGSAGRGLTAAEAFGFVSYSAIPLFLLNPFFEELIVRAYLMTEIRDLTGSSLLSILVSVVIQSSYHLYYGWQGALSLAFQFLVFSIFYARSRRITPVIIAHAFFDIIGLVQLW